MCIYSGFSHHDLHDHARVQGDLPREVLKRNLFLRLPAEHPGELPLAPYRDNGSCNITLSFDRLCPQASVQHEFIDCFGIATERDCRDCNAWSREWRGKTEEEIEKNDKDVADRLEQDQDEGLQHAMQASLVTAARDSLKRKLDLSGEAQPHSQDHSIEPAHGATNAQSPQKAPSENTSSHPEQRPAGGAGEQPGKRLRLRGAHRPESRHDNHTSQVKIKQEPSESSQQSSLSAEPQEVSSSSATGNSNPSSSPTLRATIGTPQQQRAARLAHSPLPLAITLRRRPSCEWANISKEYHESLSKTSSPSKPSTDRGGRDALSQDAQDTRAAQSDVSTLDRGSDTPLSDQSSSSGEQVPEWLADIEVQKRAVLRKFQEDLLAEQQSAKLSTSPHPQFDEHEEIALAIQDGSFDRATSAFFHRDNNSTSNPKTPKTQRSQERASAPPYMTPSTFQRSTHSSSPTLVNSSSTLRAFPTSPSPATRTGHSQSTPVSSAPASPTPTTAASASSQSPSTSDGLPQHTPQPTPQEHATITRLRAAYFALVDEYSRLLQQRVDDLKNVLKRE